MSINQRVKELRQELNLTQVKFAKDISVSSGYIAGIEVGNRKVNDRIARLICITFNVSEKWLKTGEGDMFNKAPSRLTEIACSTFQELKPAYQEYVLKQIDQLLEIQRTEDQE